MDGGEDDDSSLREHVDVAPPVEQAHVERERNRAAAEARLPLAGSAAHRELSLTGAFQSTFPAHRQRTNFGLLSDPVSLLVISSLWTNKARSPRS